MHSPIIKPMFSDAQSIGSEGSESERIANNLTNNHLVVSAQSKLPNTEQTELGCEDSPPAPHPDYAQSMPNTETLKKKQEIYISKQKLPVVKLSIAQLLHLLVKPITDYRISYRFSSFKVNEGTNMTKRFEMIVAGFGLNVSIES